MCRLYVLFIAILIIFIPIFAQVHAENPGAVPQNSSSAPFLGFFGSSPGMTGYTGSSGYVYPAEGATTSQLGAGTGVPHISAPIGIPITSNKTMEIIDKYLNKTNNDDLFPARLFEYNTHFEVELKEKDTQRGAFELIIDKLNGRVCAENGPNLVWNNKYGINGNYFGIQPALSVSVGDSLRAVGDFIKRTSPELKIEGDVTEYYGYYEFHVTLEGKLAIEINVNGFNGQMWIENWHGSLLREVDLERE